MLRDTLTLDISDDMRVDDYDRDIHRERMRRILEHKGIRVSYWKTYEEVVEMFKQWSEE